ncbi:MAG: indole-3-glycerol phosphate synthase TrpC [Gemmatimonadetes bacterium]|nr:indole-3-glycerol phosphate synthase TrpC [Gemmatimonadota bacterium]
MNVLDRIVRSKQGELDRLRSRAGELREAAASAGPPRGFARALSAPERVRVVAEVKRRSPGAGQIFPDLVPERLAREYEGAGAAAISVLTDGEYFGGSLEEMAVVRAAVSLPVLRKDFILEPIQVWEARSAGADAILLIVRILGDGALRSLIAEAAALGMDALVEVHDAEELARALGAEARVIGVNNRDLTTFATRLEVSLELADRVPAECVLVSESGIRGAADVARLGEAGVDAVLVGEWLLRQERVGPALAELAGHGKVRRS